MPPIENENPKASSTLQPEQSPLIEAIRRALDYLGGEHYDNETDSSSIPEITREAARGALTTALLTFNPLYGGICKYQEPPTWKMAHLLMWVPAMVTPLAVTGALGFEGFLRPFFLWGGFYSVILFDELMNLRHFLPLITRTGNTLNSYLAQTGKTNVVRNFNRLINQYQETFRFHYRRLAAYMLLMESLGVAVGELDRYGTFLTKGLSPGIVGLLTSAIIFIIAGSLTLADDTRETLLKAIGDELININKKFEDGEL